MTIPKNIHPDHLTVRGLSVREAIAERDALARKHYGPGSHPGTGTEQTVHGGGGGHAKTIEFSQYEARKELGAVREYMTSAGVRGEVHGASALLSGPKPEDRMIVITVTTDAADAKELQAFEEWAGQQDFRVDINPRWFKRRHYAPTHPGTGTDQTVHGGGGGGEQSRRGRIGRAGERRREMRRRWFDAYDRWIAANRPDLAGKIDPETVADSYARGMTPQAAARHDAEIAGEWLVEGEAQLEGEDVRYEQEASAARLGHPDYTEHPEYKAPEGWDDGSEKRYPPPPDKPIGSGKNGYVVFFGDKRYEVYADTARAAAVQLAEFLGKKNTVGITTVLAEKEGKQVTHLPLF